MTAFLLYIVKSSLCLTIFYIFFKAILSRDTFFRLNRVLLLGGTCLCLLVPLAKRSPRLMTSLQFPLKEWENKLFVETFTPEEEGNLSLETNLAEELPTRPVLSESNRFLMALFILYISGGTFSLFCFAISVASMLKKMQATRKIKSGKYILCLSPHSIAPFSWRNYIVLSEADYQNNPQEILTHEEVHIQKGHTYDLLWLEALLLFHWFNPVVWLLKRELQEIHEYEADDEVLKKGIDATKYQLLLVKKAVGGRYTLANSFNHSKIKNRITMMLKERTNQWARLKLLLLVPVGFMAFSVFARPGTQKMPEMANSPSPISMDKGTEKQVTTQLIGGDSVPQTKKKAEQPASQQTFPPYCITVMINAKGKLNIIWKASPESKVHGKICDTDGLRSFVEEFFANVNAQDKDLVSFHLKIEMDEQTQLEKITEVRNILREVWQQQGAPSRVSSNENMRSFVKGEVPECFPIMLKYTSNGETKSVECNNRASLEALDLTGADHLTLYADKNCRMGFISQVCSTLRQKQAQLQIEYEVL